MDKNKKKFETTSGKLVMSPEIHGNESTTMIICLITPWWTTGYKKVDRQMERIRKLQL